MQFRCPRAIQSFCRGSQWSGRAVPWQTYCTARGQRRCPHWTLLQSDVGGRRTTYYKSGIMTPSRKTQRFVLTFQNLENKEHCSSDSVSLLQLRKENETLRRSGRDKSKKRIRDKPKPPKGEVSCGQCEPLVTASSSPSGRTATVAAFDKVHKTGLFKEARLSRLLLLGCRGARAFTYPTLEGTNVILAACPVRIPTPYVDAAHSFARSAAQWRYDNPEKVVKGAAVTTDLQLEINTFTRMTALSCIRSGRAFLRRCST